MNSFTKVKEIFTTDYGWYVIFEHRMIGKILYTCKKRVIISIYESFSVHTNRVWKTRITSTITLMY